MNPTTLGQTLVSVLIVLLVIVAFFFICREIVCWYWKVNKIVSLLEDISGKLNHREIQDDESDKDYTPVGLPKRPKI